MLAENQREDIRYVEAKVLSVGEEVVGVKKGDMIFYDRHAGHKIDIDKETYHVIRLGDVVVVL
jgi:co-chaperonin GroES (HSP10)